MSGDMADYFEEQDEMRANEAGRSIYSNRTQGTDMPTERPDDPLQPSDASKSGGTEEDAIDRNQFIAKYGGDGNRLRFINDLDRLLAEARISENEWMSEALVKDVKLPAIPLRVNRMINNRLDELKAALGGKSDE